MHLGDWINLLLPRRPPIQQVVRVPPCSRRHEKSQFEHPRQCATVPPNTLVCRVCFLSYPCAQRVLHACRFHISLCLGALVMFSGRGHGLAPAFCASPVVCLVDMVKPSLAFLRRILLRSLGTWSSIAEGENGAEFGRAGFSPRVTPEALQSKARGVQKKKKDSFQWYGQDQGV